MLLVFLRISLCPRLFSRQPFNQGLVPTKHCQPILSKRLFWDFFCDLTQSVDFRLVHDTNVWTMFGVHPHFSSDFDDVVHKSLETLLERKQVGEVWELGQEYLRSN